MAPQPADGLFSEMERRCLPFMWLWCSDLRSEGQDLAFSLFLYIQEIGHLPRSLWYKKKFFLGVTLQWTSILMDSQGSDKSTVIISCFYHFAFIICVWTIGKPLVVVVQLHLFFSDSMTDNCEEELPKKPVGQVSANCWSSIVQRSAHCWPTVGRQVYHKHRLPVGQQTINSWCYIHDIP